MAEEERADRFPIGLVYVALVVLGAVLGIWGAFLVPLRLPGGVEGLSVVIAFVGNVAVGLSAAIAARDLPAAAMPGIGWLVAVLLASSVSRPSDEVIIPGRLAGDPGVAVVGILYLLAGLVGALAAVALASFFTRRAERPTTKA
ncbi:MAG: hypothetical protein JO222_00150 [Frankiales bacterium]|nr:hypothetical protein [Frankiales bacterium]